MKIYLRAVCLAILFIGNINIAFAQLDSVAIDSQKVDATQPSFLKKAIVPSVLLSYGALSLGSGKLRQFDRYVNNSTIGPKGYAGSVDDYLRYGPIAAVYGLDLIGIKAKNNFIDRSAMLFISMSLTSAVVTFTKHNIHRLRPDASGISSFPSGHTAIAFTSAEFMHQEYGDKSVWYSVVGYGAATATGVLRLYHHVHWFSDVVMGAGYGILATKLSYLIYPYIKNIFTKHKVNSLLVMPTLQDNLPGFAISLNL